MNARIIPLIRIVHLATRRSLHLRGDILAGLVEEAVGVGLSLLAPLTLKVVIDALQASGGQRSWLPIEITAFVVAWSSPSLIANLKGMHTTRIVEGLAGHIGAEILRTQLPILAKSRDGDSGRVLGVLERLPYSLQIIVEGLGWRVLPTLAQTLATLLALAVLVPPAYTLILALTLIAYAASANMGSRVYAGHAAALNQSFSDVSSRVSDLLRNARRVVFNGALGLELDAMAKRVFTRRSAGEALARSLFQMSLLQVLIVCVGAGAALLLAADAAVRGRLGLSSFVLIQAYAFRLTLPLGGMALVVRQSEFALETASDAFDLLGAPAAPIQPQRAAPPLNASSGVRLERVSFRYGDGPLVINKVALAIAPAAFVLIVGLNGSGKSTLAQLIAGLLEPESGRVLVQGHDVRSIDADARHRLVLYVPQFISLLNRSLIDNALYPPTTARPEDIVALLDTWKFYSDRSVVLDVEVGEQGERLSGGQVQKLELARLVGVQTPILVLDESTSDLDGPSETRIIRRLREAAPKTTLILVAHKQSLAAIADQVVYLENGTIAGHARHNTLLQSHPSYRQLWEASIASA